MKKIELGAMRMRKIILTKINIWWDSQEQKIEPLTRDICVKRTCAEVER